MWEDPGSLIPGGAIDLHSSTVVAFSTLSCAVAGMCSSVQLVGSLIETVEISRRFLIHVKGVTLFAVEGRHDDKF